MTHVNFWGVHGSTPCDGHQFDRYGGNTSCVEVACDGHDPIVFDLGTGLRNYGDTLDGRGTGRRATAPRCSSAHLHWDHIQGLPFFAPLAAGGGTVDRRMGPHQEDGPARRVFR